MGTTPAQTPLELSKTIKINDIDYNINAVSAETADKVANKLILIPVNATKDSVSFDGNEELKFEVMTADGGEFTGNITVPSILGESSEPVNRQTVLNFDDISTKVLSDLKNNSTIYTFGPESGDLADDAILQAIHDSTLVSGTNANKINGISVVLGDSSNLETFAEKNDTLSSYFYICKSNESNIENIPQGSIFFGIGKPNEKDTLIFISKTAVEIGPDYTFSVLYDKLDNYTDYLTYIASSVFGIEFSEEGIDEEYDSTQGSILERVSTAEGEIVTVSTNLDACEDAVSELETDLDAWKANHMSLNNQVSLFKASGFYRTAQSRSVGVNDNKITISTSEPSDPKVNDIWIKIS